MTLMSFLIAQWSHGGHSYKGPYLPREYINASFPVSYGLGTYGLKPSILLHVLSQNKASSYLKLEITTPIQIGVRKY